MIKQGGALWLLGWEMKLTWRRWWGAGKGGPIRRILPWALLAIFVLAISISIAFPIARFAPHPPLTPMAIIIVSAVFGFFGALMLSGSIMSIVEVIYVRNDLDLLLASPVKPWTVLLVRTAAVALNSALFMLVLTGTPATMLLLLGAPDWFAIVPAVGGVAFFTTGIALLAVLVLFRLIGPRRTRVAAQILGALIGAAFFLASQAYNFAGGRRDQLAQQIVEFLERNDLDTTGPLFIPARAALADGTALILWLTFSFGFYLIAAYVFSANFVNDAAAAAGASRGRKRVSTDVRALRGGVTAGIVRKELRLLGRDPLLISQIGLQIVYFFPVGFILWRNMGQGETSAATHSLLSGSVTALAGFLAAGLIWIMVSAEDAPDLIAAAPVSKTAIERAKLLAASLPVFTLLLIPLGIVAVDSLIDALWLALAAIGAVVSACMIGIWYQKPGNRKDFRRRRGGSFLAGLGQTFVTLLWGIAAGMAVSGWAIVAIIPAIVALGLLLAMGESKPKPA